MTNAFFDRPILNSPYENPSRHWELDHGQPTQQIVEKRRPAEYITPLPKPKKRKGQAEQTSLLLDDDQGLSTQAQQYEKTAAIINAVRQEVGKWRALPNPNTWHVTPETTAYDWRGSGQTASGGHVVPALNCWSRTANPGCRSKPMNPLRLVTL